jgi:hypothetical protein
MAILGADCKPEALGRKPVRYRVVPEIVTNETSVI